MQQEQLGTFFLASTHFIEMELFNSNFIGEIGKHYSDILRAFPYNGQPIERHLMEPKISKILH